MARRGGAGAAALPAIVSPARPHRARGLAFRCLLALVEPPTARAGKNALAICTISDSLVTGEECTAQERQTTFTQMMELALEIA